MTFISLLRSSRERFSISLLCFFYPFSASGVSMQLLLSRKCVVFVVIPFLAHLLTTSSEILPHSKHVQRAHFERFVRFPGGNCAYQLTSSVTVFVRESRTSASTGKSNFHSFSLCSECKSPSTASHMTQKCARCHITQSACASHVDVQCAYHTHWHTNFCLNFYAFGKSALDAMELWIR